jgi:hypothetical protein
MKKIKYNIADNKKIDQLKFASISILIIVVAALLFFYGIYNIKSVNQSKQDKLEEMNGFKVRLSDVVQKTDEYNRKIKKIKKVWKSKVNLSNNLINKKSFSFIQRLNKLEKLLPVGAFISTIAMKNNPKAVVQLNVVSSSFPNLVEVYKQFAAYNLHITRESISDGIYKANLNVTLTDEKN